MDDSSARSGQTGLSQADGASFCQDWPVDSAAPTPRCRQVNARGFTLLELVIAFTIFGLMAGLVFSSFRLVLNSYEKSQERLGQEARKRVLQDHIKRQIGSLFPVRPSGAFLGIQEGKGQMQLPSAVSQFPLFDGRPDSVTFVTVAPLVLRENPGLTVVRYGLAEDEWGKYYLGMMETRYVGLESFMGMVEVPLGKPLPLVENVNELRFQYYGYDAENQDYQWFDSWIGEELLAVPDAIRIDYDDSYLIVSSNADFYSSQLGRQFQRLIQD